MNPPASSATRIRHALLGVATVNAFLLYLDRFCMTTVVHTPSFLHEVGLNEQDVGNVLAAFFLAYAVGQLPGGWLADRFGPRRMLVIYIVLWSTCTALTGFAKSLGALIALRLACGFSEAGAYPASGRAITRWFPFGHRSRANALVGFGGRVGNALAPWLTVMVIAFFGSWRPVLWVYGGIGLLLALATYVVFRDFPGEHPWANDAERALILEGGPPPSNARFHFPWRALLTHRGLWLQSLGGIGMNFGWAFLVTWLPRYMQQVRGLGEKDANGYVTLALGFGMLGVLFGGWWCDALTGWFGPRWGRSLPVVIGAVICASIYLLCPVLPGATTVAVACALVAFASDSTGPAIWSMSQDIGHNHVAATMAWSNMWGNFGASAVARCIPLALASSLHFADWREVFWMCAGGYVVLAITILFVDATRHLPDEDSPC